MIPSAAVLEIPNQLVKMYGKADPTTAPIPIKKLCIAKPNVRWFSGKLSPTKARKGSIEMLIDESMIHNVPMATQSVGELGIIKSAIADKMAPTKK